MYKLYISIKKEVLQLINDKVGLLIMFAMPLLLVVIITLIQDSTFKLVKENKISMLVVNRDAGAQGKKLTEMLAHSGMFTITTDSTIAKSSIKSELLKQNRNVALYIPENFSDNLRQKASEIGTLFLTDLGVKDSASKSKPVKLTAIDFFHDPVLQDNYCYSIIGVVQSYLQLIENNLMVENMYTEMGDGKTPASLKNVLSQNQVAITKTAATNANFDIMPNATQHNVPAWTVFAMFFMVVSLGSNIVAERNNGSFIRLKTMPTNFWMVLSSKMGVYLFAAILQVVLIFSVGKWLFPLIKLTPLTLPNDLMGLSTVVLLSGLAAVSYALLVGSLAKTQEQANGFGAVSIIIFAALGGIWVPVFVMPGYLKTISQFSPLYWCLEGFYTVFLKGGSWNELLKVALFLLSFTGACLLVVFGSLKRSKII